ncbi:efflux RND transporter permease subunit [Patescibacteria group bacterium]|nr:efflux RND transporter permease subunit [Patescibacteria group bacterium]
MNENNIENKKDEAKNKFAHQAIIRTRKSFKGYFITHFRVIILMISAIVIMGALALASIPRESDPEVKIPIAVVTTVYPGASPADVENLVTDEIENRLEELDNVKLITSASRNSISSITVEFEAEANLDDSIRELKDKVGEVTGLPGDAEDPVVTQIRANDYPIITFSLSGDLTDNQFKQLGEIVQDELEGISGVSKVPLLGVRDKEFSVLVDKTALSRLNLSLSTIVGAIRASNLDMPLGNIDIDDLHYNIRSVGKLNDIDNLKNVVVANNNGQIVLLKDIAQVNEQFVDRSNISRISIAGETTQENISLQIYKKTGGNILDIVDSAKAKVNMLSDEKVIPDNVKIEINSDYSSFIRDDLHTLGSSGIQATILIFIIMFIALSFKEAIIALLAIPLSLLITIIALYFSGYTLNSMSLYALVLSLGLLVDAFIVVLEGIFHNIREGYSSKDAALLSVAHYSGPVTSGMLTTVAAFFPMLLVSGILGEYLKIFPITIGITLTASLFVSLILVPSFASIFLKKSQFVGTAKESILEKYVTNKLRRLYRKNITIFLRSKKSKFRFSIILTILFVASLGLLVTQTIPVQLFPKMDADFAYVDIKMPIGTNLETTSQLVSQIEEKLYKYPEIKNFVSTIGQSSSIGSFDPSRSSEHLANISIDFVDKKERSKKSYDIVDSIREDIKTINEGDISITELSGGPPTGSPIEARISGEDLLVLDSISNKVKNILENTEGVINVSSNQDLSPADLTFTLNKETVAKSGLTVADVSNLLRTAIFGVTATEISQDNNDLDVVVKLDKNKIDSVEQIKNLSLINNYGQEVKLSYLADFSLEPALATIRHRDFERTISVSADLASGYTAAKVVPGIEELVAQENIAHGYRVDFGGEVEDIQQSFTELWNAMIVAVILILIILVLEFDSFIRTGIILMSLPLMLIGVVVGMGIFGLPFSFMVFLGLVSLAGIGVNDAIVLMDKTKRNIEEKNMTPLEAVADAGDTRLQPILLTTITTIMGVIPLAFANEFWVGLSISIIFGLAFATVIQLFVIPMLFVRFEGKKKNKKDKADIPEVQYSK